jgi:hypothetical protein
MLRDDRTRGPWPLVPSPAAITKSAVAEPSRTEPRGARPSLTGCRTESWCQLRNRRFARWRCGGLGLFAARQRHAGGIVIGGHHVPAARIEDPFGHVQAVTGDESELYLPASVAPLLRVPLSVFGVGADRLQPLGHDLAKSGTRRAIALASYRRGLGLVRYVGAFSQDRTLEPAHAFDRNAGRVGDLLHRFPGPDSCLNLLGSQGALHFDLVLHEPGCLAKGNRPEPLVYRQREACATPRYCEDSVTTIFAHRDEAQFLHRRPFRSGPSPVPVLPPPDAALPWHSGVL